MSEKFADITIGDERFDANRENTTIYNHYGQGELYDHVFVQVTEARAHYGNLR